MEDGLVGKAIPRRAWPPWCPLCNPHEWCLWQDGGGHRITWELARQLALTQKHVFIPWTECLQQELDFSQSWKLFWISDMGGGQRGCCLGRVLSGCHALLNPQVVNISFWDHQPSETMTSFHLNHFHLPSALSANMSIHIRGWVSASERFGTETRNSKGPGTSVSREFTKNQWSEFLRRVSRGTFWMVSTVATLSLSQVERWLGSLVISLKLKGPEQNWVGIFGGNLGSGEYISFEMIA